MKILIAGEINNYERCEWFPAFNQFFCETYLSRNYTIEFLPCTIDPSDSLMHFTIPGIKENIKINRNTLILINADNHKAVAFTSFFNLRVLYDWNKDFFDLHLDHLYSGHYNALLVENEWPLSNKISPWYFRPLYWQTPMNKYSPKNENLFFRGLKIDKSRNFVDIIHNKDLADIDVQNTKLPPEDYFTRSSEALANLSAPGIRDMCNRDIELLMNGIPMIRPRFTSELLIPIPDEVYFPIDHDYIQEAGNQISGMPANHENLASLVIDKWHEIKGQKNKLEETSRAAKDFYLQNLTPDIIAKKSLELLSNSEYFEIHSSSNLIQTKPMKSKLTIVSGLWNISRSDRDFSIYLDHFDKFLKIPANMVLFIPKALENYVWERRNPDNTLVKIYELDDIKNIMFKPFWDRLQKIRTSENWRNQAIWLRNSPQCDNEWYNPIVMSKMFFLHDAKIWNHFNSDYFMWLDAGITQTCPEGYFYNQTVLEDITKHMDPFLFLSYPYEALNEIHGFEFDKMNDIVGDKVSYVCRGGLFGGHIDFLSRANTDYYHLLDRTLNDGLAGTEESVFTIISYLQPSNYRRYVLDQNGLVVKYLQNLDSKSAELVPLKKKINRKIKRTPVDLSKINTSLYFLTFNYPEQLEFTLKSIQQQDGFFTHPKNKFLIDNSTNKEAIKQNEILCKKYGLIHLVQDKNTGICGGRLFAAEHFHKSEADYYIFFEDDMTLSSDKNGTCRNGFRKYVPNLYKIAHKIIMQEEFDFLKFSFTEVYMDNHIQVSWYNVPQHIRDRDWPDYNTLPISGTDQDSPRTVFDKIDITDGLAYISGEIYYANWPHIMGRKGNKKLFIDVEWPQPYEQIWMSHIYQETKKGNISASVLLASPISHDRFKHYSPEERIES